MVMSDDEREVLPGVTPGMLAALEAGVPWWLAREALASVRLDRDDEGGTHAVE
jgi:hypothetical protein